MHKLTEHFCISEAGDWLVTVQPDEVGKVWGEVGPLLAPAVALGATETLGQVREGLEAGRYQLWTAVRGNQIEGAWCTRLAEYASERVCEIVYCGGHDIERWLDITVEPVSWWARERGCKRIRIFGRRGWVKLLPEFREVLRVLERDI